MPSVEKEISIHQTIKPEFIALAFLKYLSLKPLNVFLGDDGETEIRLWLCQEHGTPLFCSGLDDTMPLDIPIVYMYVKKYRE